MKKLIRLLKQAHAIEIGAYNAYEGHWRSLPINSVSQRTIKAIQIDELDHKESVREMLSKLDARPSPALNGVLWIIGKSISIACHVMGYRMAMWGAKIMEILGADIYEKLAEVAREEGYHSMSIELYQMQRAEEDHERFIKILLKDRKKLMLNPIEMGAVATASLGGLTVLWSNIKGIFARLESLIVVKAELSGSNMTDDFVDYCWAHFKVSPLGIRSFSSGDQFIRPKNRHGRVANEKTGKYITFWNGHRPLFVSCGGEKNSGNIYVSFIRGTFDLERLIVDAVNFYDIHKHEKSTTSSRYYVRRCFGRNKKFEKGDGSQTPISSSNTSDEINNTGYRPLFYGKEELGIPTSKKPMDNLAYEEGVLEFYQEAVRWKESKNWFKDKGLSWRFGAGLFGPPGTGKSSLARAIGQGLDMPIHSYDLTTMDNEELVRCWQDSLGESPCIVLLEDVDRIFDENKQIKTNRDKSPLTLDCLLNCISGVQPSDGILVLVTANDVTKLDPALGVPDMTGKSTRPGRLDRAIYIGILTEEGRYKIANRILSDTSDLINETVLKGEGETGAQFEGRCSKLALEQYWGRFKLYGAGQIDFTNIDRAEVPGTNKTMDELRREDSYA